MGVTINSLLEDFCSRANYSKYPNLYELTEKALKKGSKYRDFFMKQNNPSASINLGHPFPITKPSLIDIAFSAQNYLREVCFLREFEWVPDEKQEQLEVSARNYQEDIALIKDVDVDMIIQVEKGNEYKLLRRVMINSDFKLQYETDTRESDRLRQFIQKTLRLAPKPGIVQRFNVTKSRYVIPLNYTENGTATFYDSQDEELGEEEFIPDQTRQIGKDFISTAIGDLRYIYKDRLEDISESQDKLYEAIAPIAAGCLAALILQRGPDKIKVDMENIDQKIEILQEDKAHLEEELTELKGYRTAFTSE